jgi:hypothetical protein
MTHKSLQDKKDVSDELLDQIGHFFVSYYEAKGQGVKAEGPIRGWERAVALVPEGIAKRPRGRSNAQTLRRGLHPLTETNRSEGAKATVT